MKKIIITTLIMLLLIGCTSKTKSDIELKNINQFLEENSRSLGVLIIVSTIDNYHTAGTYKVTSEKNLIESNENKQLFIMEKILEDNSNYDKFIVGINNETFEIIDEKPTSDMTLAYIPYNDFNKYYKKYFNEDFNTKKAKKSAYENVYDKSNDYVYYENRRPGMNGLYVENIKANNIKYNKKTKEYSAEITITYSNKEQDILGYKTDQGIICYEKENENIFLKTFIIKR